MEIVMEIVWMMVSVFALTLNEVNWSKAGNSGVLAIRDAVIGVAHKVTFVEVKQLDNGAIVCTVKSDTLAGGTLWLSSADYGYQNGAMSLIHNAKKDKAGNPKIEGNTFTFTKVDSDKSPTGFAYHWK